MFITNTDFAIVQVLLNIIPTWCHQVLENHGIHKKSYSLFMTKTIIYSLSLNNSASYVLNKIKKITYLNSFLLYLFGSVKPLFSHIDVFMPGATKCNL